MGKLTSDQEALLLAIEKTAHELAVDLQSADKKEATRAMRLVQLVAEFKTASA